MGTARLAAVKHEIDSMTPAQTLDHLRSVFELYSDKSVLVEVGKHEINITGFLRLLRDASLLDNRLTPVQADVLFTGMPVKQDRAAMPKVSSAPCDMFS